VTGVTTNPTIFDRAVTGSDVYDENIRRQAARLSPSDDRLELAR